MDHDPRLGLRYLDALDGLPDDAQPAISDISLWEVATLLERGRVRFEIPLEEWLRAAAHPRTVRVVLIARCRRGNRLASRQLPPRSC